MWCYIAVDMLSCFFSSGSSTALHFLELLGDTTIHFVSRLKLILIVAFFTASTT